MTLTLQSYGEGCYFEPHLTIGLDGGL